MTWLADLAQFFWHFDDPLLFLYKHRPPGDTHKAAFLSSCLIYVKLCTNATQWRKDEFLQIPPTLYKPDAETGASPKRFFFRGPAKKTKLFFAEKTGPKKLRLRLV